MTQPSPPPAGVKTHTLTFENGGPLDGDSWEVAVNTSVVHALAYKRDDGTWGHPSDLLTEEDIAAGANPVSPTTWPETVRSRVVQVEYLVDKDRGSASFREPAEIRDDRDEDEIPPQFRPADPRAQAATALAEQAMTRAYDVIEPFDRCQHEPPCRSASLHWARHGVDALVADGLRIVEPAHIAAGASDTFARLLHDAFDREMGDPADPSGWDDPQHGLIREQWQAVAEDVLSVLDVNRKVVVIRPTEDMLGADFAALAEALRTVGGADLMLALAPGSTTLESVDRDGMRAAGWVKVEDGQPMLAEADVRAYLDGCITHWRGARRRRQDDGDMTAVGECAAYVDAYQSARVSLLGALLPPEPVEEEPPGDTAPAAPAAAPVPVPEPEPEPEPERAETIAQRDMRERRLRAAKAQQTFETQFVGCPQPAEGQGYVVVKEEWSDDYTVRRITEWKPADA